VVTPTAANETRRQSVIMFNIRQLLSTYHLELF
jgi:hypothetical protein